MKVLFLLFLFSSLNLTAVNYQERFLQANEYYKEGKVEEAFNLYNSIPKKSGIINYNLGNCAYKQKKYGLALAYWKKAEKHWGIWNKSDLRHNISTVEQKVLPRSYTDRLTTFLAKFKNEVFSYLISVPLSVLQILFLALWLFLFVYLKFLYRNKHKILIILLFLLIAIFGTLLAIRYSLEFRRYGVVVKPQAQLLSGPDNRFSVLGELPEVLEVVISKELNGYYKIKFDGGIGWISKVEVEEI
ncbi:tetratricopeptide repeat protein [Candidatus Babeliales bacterium]|nr:tetratricopeptide repeat protein [Candidatus Babeliales bacterium]